MADHYHRREEDLFEDDESEHRWVPVSWVIVGIILLTVLGSILLTYQDMLAKRQPATAVAQLTLIASSPQTTMTTSAPQPPTATLSPLVTPTSTPSPLATESPTLTPQPTPSSTRVCHPPSFWYPYTAKHGDSLVILALRYGVSVQTIMQANCLTEQSIYPGQRLYLPPLNATAIPTRIPLPCGPPPYHWRIYTVQRDDTIYALAQRYRTTIDKIGRANCLQSYTLYIGQRLYLPPPPYIPPTPTSVTPWIPSATATSEGPVTPTTTSTATSEGPAAPTATVTSPPTAVPPDTATTVPTAPSSPTTEPTATSAPPVPPSPTTEPTAPSVPTVPPAPPTVPAVPSVPTAPPTPITAPTVAPTGMPAPTIAPTVTL